MAETTPESQNSPRKLTRRDFLQFLGTTVISVLAGSLSGCYSVVEISTPSPTPTETPPEDPAAPVKTRAAERERTRKILMGKAAQEAGRVCGVIQKLKSEQNLTLPESFSIVTFSDSIKAKVLEGVNVREAPSLQADIVEIFPQNTEFPIIGWVILEGGQIWAVTERDPNHHQIRFVNKTLGKGEINIKEEEPEEKIGVKRRVVVSCRVNLASQGCPLIEPSDPERNDENFKIIKENFEKGRAHVALSQK